nr:unnamed protein product [Digitaria exilis]
MTTGETHEASRREGRDSHGRRHHSSSRSRRDDPSPRRRRDDRRHESARHRSRDEESAKVSDRDQKRNRDAEQRDDPPNAESKSHNERGSAGQGGRLYDRQASGYGRQRDQKEHLADRDKQKDAGHTLQGKVEQDDGDSTWRHDGFFQLEEEAPLAKKRPTFQEMKMQDSAATGVDMDSGSRKPDQPGPTSAIREERRSYHLRGFGNHRPFVRPDDRGFRRGFPDHRSDSRGRFPGRGGVDRDRFSNPYGGRGNAYNQSSGDQEEKWKHDLYDQSNSSPPPKTEEEQIAKVEALLAL